MSPQRRETNGSLVVGRRIEPSDVADRAPMLKAAHHFWTKPRFRIPIPPKHIRSLYALLHVAFVIEKLLLAL